LSVGVFGTLVMHSPKVPHPDFSVQVVRHNLKIFAVENFGRRLRRSLDVGGSNAQPRKARRLGQPVRGATRGRQTLANPPKDGPPAFTGLRCMGFRLGIPVFAGPRFLCHTFFRPLHQTFLGSTIQPFPKGYFPATVATLHGPNGLAVQLVSPRNHAPNLDSIEELSHSRRY
jgi:hypothetical protein